MLILTFQLTLRFASKLSKAVNPDSLCKLANKLLNLGDVPGAIKVVNCIFMRLLKMFLLFTGQYKGNFKRPKFSHWIPYSRKVHDSNNAFS